MNKATLSRAEAATSRFLSKVKKENEPFQAFLRTDAYKQLYTLIEDAALEQGYKVAQALRDLDTSNTLAMNDDLQPLNDNQLGHVATLVKDVMPTMADLIDADELYEALEAAFVFSVKQQYKRWGIIVKASTSFDLTNANYRKMLEDQANYLLNLSSIDDTTTEQLVTLIRDGKLNALTIDEIADEIDDQFVGISEKRAFVIARTETSQAMGSGNLATMKENGVQRKKWITAGSNPCAICLANEAQGFIPVDEDFESGDAAEPAHPNDECYTEAEEIDLDSIDIWSGE